MWSLRLNTQTIQKILLGGTALGLLLLPAVVAAETVTQAYGVSGTLQNGMIVMLDPSDSSKVQALTNKKSAAMQGVVVAANDSAVTLSGDASNAQAYVATTGTYDVLVSTQSGVIKSGDLISISALDGIGMKATGDQPLILGKALEGFDGTNNVSGTTTLTGSNGSKTTVSIGLISVTVGISHNPLANSGTDAAAPSFLRKLAAAIAGKPVPAARIYIGLAIILATVSIAGSILYAGVRSSLIAVGRNPLARSTVFRGLFQVVLVGLIIFLVGLLGTYLLLRL